MCPLEAKVEAALKQAGVRVDSTDNVHPNLDFFLPDYGVYIEVKGAHTPRVNEQLSRSKYVILLQGQTAVDAFCSLINK